MLKRRCGTADGRIDSKHRGTGAAGGSGGVCVRLMYRVLGP